MKKIALVIAVGLLFACKITAQTTASLKGKIVEATSQKLLKGVVITVKGTTVAGTTNAQGVFLLKNIPLKNYVLHIAFPGFQIQKMPIEILENRHYNIGTIYLEPFVLVEQDIGIVTLTEDDLLDDEASSSSYISGLFQASKDVFLRAAAFSFSQAWFKVRGYDASNGAILINGVSMNKLYGGRPQWSQWGGLNDVFKNQEYSNGIAASQNAFGGVLGTTNFSTKASDYQVTKKISLSSTNKSYRGRIMSTYASGLTKNNTALVISASRRFAQEGYLQGTPYNSWAAFLATEKIISPKHSINFTAFIASNKRGKSSPNTQEVYNLKGYKYNAYWGLQEGAQRSARTKIAKEPVLMLSHFYEGRNTKIKTTASYQFGFTSSSRLGYFNAPNPDPTYWKYLPSYFLRFQEQPNYANAYLAEQAFINYGQINWRLLYQTNANHGKSLYYVYSDKTSHNKIGIHTTSNTNLSPEITLNTKLSFQKLNSHNYAQMDDLLGGSSFIDLDPFAVGNAQQNNVNNPNNEVLVGDKFQYNYRINSSVASAFAQLQFAQKKTDYFVGILFKSTQTQRNGLFKNGSYPNNSFGKGASQQFSNLGVKAGLTYKFTGRHLLYVNASYLSKAPTLRNIFSNARVNNTVTPNISSEKIQTTDVNYVFRNPKFQIRTTAYYTQFTNAVETSFFFAQGLLGDQADFVNQIVTGIAKKHMGLELSASYQITPAIKLLGAVALGEFTYHNNPKLYLYSESFSSEKSDFGTAFLKNYHLSGTPQRAYFAAFEYRDPAYWWFQINANYLTHNYLSISPLLRTHNFYLDTDGVPFIDNETGVQVTQTQVNDLLVQEKFNPAFLLNVVGGKSWKIADNYLGFFIGINNALGTVFKTGGFEQSRNANYSTLKEDQQREKPLFGAKYWYGNSASYYVNLYVRF